MCITSFILGLVLLPVIIGAKEARCFHQGVSILFKSVCLYNQCRMSVKVLSCKRLSSVGRCLCI